MGRRRSRSGILSPTPFVRPIGAAWNCTLGSTLTAPATTAKGPAANRHISRTHPQLVRSYDGYQWLDPAEPAAAAHSLKVILDVTRRYDVDGIHIDDYFYPYPAANRAPFPDEASWKTFQGDMDRKDWRRMHINNFIKRLHTEIHKIKPHVKFGISPFGIWRPGYPKQIKGLDAYGTLYADARLWLREGWLDYCAPQLYWRSIPRSSYPVLLQWWHEQNPKRRHLWPGNNSAKVEPWPATEILKPNLISPNIPVSPETSTGTSAP